MGASRSGPTKPFGRKWQLLHRTHRDLGPVNERGFSVLGVKRRELVMMKG